MDNEFDHPDVVHALRTGYPRPHHPVRRWCPICDRTLSSGSKLYIHIGDIVGCQFCIEESTAEEEFD